MRGLPLALLTTLMLASACSPKDSGEAVLGDTGKATPTESADETDKLIVAGAELFGEKCSRCHPRGGRSDFIKRIPATLLTRRSEQELITWIVGRDQHREMPSFTDLSEEQLNSLVAFLMAEKSH